MIPSVILLNELKKRYNFEYKQQSKTIIAFMFAESFSLVFNITRCLMVLFEINCNTLDDLYSIYSVSATRTTIQSLGFVYLKKSRDPMYGL